jgi:hypothetical protein
MKSDSSLKHDSSLAVRFSLSADSSPGLLSRLLEPFARRDLIPDEVAARCSGAVLEVEIALAAMPAEMLSYVEGNLRQVVGLRTLVRNAMAPRALAA